MEDSDLLLIQLVILGALLVILRFLYLIHKITTGWSSSSGHKRTSPAKTLIILGSGGHTTELLQLTHHLDPLKYSPRFYVLADSDVTSIGQLERSLSSLSNIDFKTIVIPRSRYVGQSYFSSIFSTANSVVRCFVPLLRIRPDLIICNGPGTCLPLCLVALCFRVAFVCDTRVVFIESFCRAKTLSLTGKILKYCADNFVVQWPDLRRRVRRATYLGQLL